VIVDILKGLTNRTTSADSLLKLAEEQLIPTPIRAESGLPKESEATEGKDYVIIEDAKPKDVDEDFGLPQNFNPAMMQVGQSFDILTQPST